MTTPTPAWLVLAHYCHAFPSHGRDDALVVAGAWDAIMAQCSAADLKPVRVRDGAELDKFDAQWVRLVRLVAAKRRTG